MKRLFLSLMIAAMAGCLSAQTLNVRTGSVLYKFPAAQAGRMTYQHGDSLTIINKGFALQEIDAMYVDESAVTDNSVQVTYNATEASLVVAGNVARYLTIEQTGAHVSIVQSSDLAQEITYTLSGTSADGGFYMDGKYKATVELNGLTLTNVSAVYSGAPVHVQNSKRIKVKVVTGTTNTLVDAATGSQKGCLYIKGHAEFAQKGTLNITANVKHGIKTGEYMTLKNAVINILSAAGDGINCSQFFLMESGTVTMTTVGDDGLQCDLDKANTGITDKHDEEDTGNIYIADGTIDMTVTAAAAKGLKAEGEIYISGGTLNITTTGGGTWDEDDEKTKAASCISSDANIYISGGTMTLKSTGSGGKGIKCDSLLTISGEPVIDITTTGGLYYNDGTTENSNYTGNTDRIDSKYYSAAKGIRAGTKTEVTTNNRTSYTYAGGMVISGGTITVSTAGYNAEGIESKNDMTISGGTITVNSYDDGINSAQNMYIKGGVLTVVSKNNDAIDANANLYIQGGTVLAFGAGAPECGLDAAEGYYLYITGGTVLAVGGNNNTVTATTGSQALVSASASLTAGTTVSVTPKNGSTAVCSFTVPSTYTGSSQGGGGFFAGGGPGGGRPGSGSSLLISDGGLSSGTQYTITYGSSSTTATAATSYRGM